MPLDIPSSAGMKTTHVLVVGMVTLLLSLASCLPRQGGVSEAEPRIASSMGSWPPSHLAPLFEKPTENPSRELLVRLTEQDRDVLMEWYKHTKQLDRRFAVTIALGYVGNEETVALFKHTLLEEYRGRRLSNKHLEPHGFTEVEVFYQTVIGLGMLAQKSDSAFEFLKQALAKEFWMTHTTWIPTARADAQGILSASTIQAIGLSGRPEVRELLLRLSGADLDYPSEFDGVRSIRDCSGSVCTAAFYDYVLRTRGLEALRLSFGDERIDEYYKEWAVSDDGKQWVNWNRSRSSK